MGSRGGQLPKHTRKTTPRERRPDSALEHLEQRLFVRAAYVLGLLFAAFEDDHGGNAAHAITLRDSRCVIDVELTDLVFPAGFVRESFDDGRENFAGAAPSRRE